MNSVTPASFLQTQQFTISLGRLPLVLVTQPGLPAWELVSPSTQLFIEHAVLKPAFRVLLFGCHLGAVAAFLARAYPGLELSITDRNYTALEMARQTLEANHIDSVGIIESVELPEQLYGALDAAYVQLPKGRQLARRWLLQAFHGLADGGSLYLAGANAAGIQSVIKDAQGLFGNGRVLAYKKGNRIAQFIRQPADRPAPEWARSPGISPGSWVEFPLTLAGRTFSIRSLPGVFSYDHLDQGTHMLLQAARVAPGSSVLDVGCGYGVIGLAAAAEGAGRVHLVDNDLLAIASCSATLSVNGISCAQAFAGDLLAPVSSDRYDQILSNPPFHAGQAVDYQVAQALIGQSYQALAPGGQLVIVANRFIRYDRLIDSIFGNVSTLAESGKFHVFSGLKSS